MQPHQWRDGTGLNDGDRVPGGRVLPTQSGKSYTCREAAHVSGCLIKVTGVHSPHAPIWLSDVETKPKRPYK
jgi:hypothetical protein